MTSSIGHMPTGERWAFDEGVADVFDDMLRRSIPQYEVMRETVVAVASRHLRPASTVVDLGCSWGGALEGVRRAAFGLFGAEPDIRYRGLEVSPSMLKRARQVFQACPDVEIIEQDFRLWEPTHDEASVVLAVLALQFAPINYRQRVIQRAFQACRTDGCFVFVEKVLGEGPDIDELMVDVYHAAKREQGYPDEEITAKERALEGVLVPVTAAMNERMLRHAGFREVDCFWRWMNFAGWLAVK
jgi:tRNA (cmo5U34)-methyltransferase